MIKEYLGISQSMEILLFCMALSSFPPLTRLTWEFLFTSFLPPPPPPPPPVHKILLGCLYLMVVVDLS